MIQHISVMAQEVSDYFQIRSNHNYVDCTLGGGGHTRSMLDQCGPKGKVLALELDLATIERTKKSLAEYKKRLIIEKTNFRHLKTAVEKNNIHPIDGILYDLGLSIDLIKQSNRGFTFLEDEPLDMRFDTSQERTAEDIVNKEKEEDLANTIFQLGGERYSRRIAKAIVVHRAQEHITTTGQLEDIIFHAVPVNYRHRRVHPATKTFQALRMAVNDELGSIETSLRDAIELLAPEGKIIVISFHSLEDGLIKRLFKEFKRNGWGEILTKKPITPTETEIKENPASRSAKLRAFQKK